MTRRQNRWRTLAIAASLALVAASFLGLATAAGAQTFGRVKFKVTTPDGEPATGVKITVTCRERGGYRQDLETNNKGEAVLSVVDATKLYQFRLDYEGYPSLEDEIKPELRQTITREVVLMPTAPPPPSAEARLTPAQQAFNAGITAAQTDDLATARARFEEAAALDAKLAPPHLALAGLALDDEDYETAVRHAGRVIELEADNARAYRILHAAHTQLGNKKEAKAALDALEGLGEGADAAAVIYNEGVAAFRVGDNATAEASFLRALELQADLTSAVSALGVLYMQSGRHAEAAAMAERALALEPGNARMLRLRWDAYRAAGDEAKAREAHDALAAADPQVLVSELFDEGARLFEAGDVQGAQRQFESVLEIAPEHARAHYQLGLCLVNAGDTAAAREHIRKFLELAPDDPEAATAREMLTFLGE
jgi:tetratricopeptide (TPR) repeat protein